MSGPATVRPPAVAGTFYPAEADALRRLVRAGFADAAPADPGAPAPRALVVPHAGLVYSGAVAASAYQRLAPIADQVRRIVLLGPSHRVAFAGIAATGADAWATPLGTTAIDRATTDAVVAAGLAFPSDRAHAPEHSLEVQLPFLQTVVPDAVLAPFVVGDAGTDEVAALLAAVWDLPGTVVVISTDLSHYHRHAEAVELDRRTAAGIVAARPEAIGDLDACGSRGLRGLLAEVGRRHLTVEQLDLRTSGDTAGDRDRVVGYGAFAVA